jgi:hypothetical protein
MGRLLAVILLALLASPALAGAAPRPADFEQRVPALGQVRTARVLRRSGDG